MFGLVNGAINVTSISQKLQDPRCGAMVTFEGWVRNHHQGNQVLHLSYESFDALCQTEAKKLKRETLEKFDIKNLHCVHRVGHCEIGTLVVWVGVSSHHRKEAFEACEYYVDQLKVRFPIWKKETYTDGESTWIKSVASREYR